MDDAAKQRQWSARDGLGRRVKKLRASSTSSVFISAVSLFRNAMDQTGENRAVKLVM
jgi:hypothetical protein